MLKAIRLGPLFIGIAALAFALSLHFGRNRSLTADEGLTLHLVSQSLSQGLSPLLYEIHTPLYNFLLAAWSLVAGVSPESAKLLSACLTALSVVLVYLFARRRFDGRTAVIAASLLALAPLHVYYSQSVRTYILLIATATLSSRAYLDYFDDLGRRSGTKYLLATSLLVYSHLTGFAVVLAQWIHFVAFAARFEGLHRIPSWLRLQALLALLYSPVILAITFRFDFAQDLPSVYSWVESPALGDLLVRLADLAGQSRFHELGLAYGIPILFAALTRKERSTDPAPDGPPVRIATSAYLWLWYLVPGIAAFIYSWIHAPIPLLRAMVPGIVPLAILAADGLARMTRRWRVSWALFCVILLMSLRIDLRAWSHDREGWFGLPAQMQPRRSDLVLIWPSILMYPYALYAAPECFGSADPEKCLNSRRVYPFNRFSEIEKRLSAGTTVWLIGHAPGASSMHSDPEVYRLLKAIPDYTEALKQKQVDPGLSAVRFTVPVQRDPASSNKPLRPSSS